MERKDLEGLVIPPAPNAQCWPSGLVEKLQSVSVVSSDDTLSCKEWRSQHDFGVPEFQNASQTLCHTGKLSETIPDGFYFVTPERRLKELFNIVPSLDDLHTLDIEGLRPNVIVVDAHKDKKLFMLKQLAATLAKGPHSSPAARIKKISGLDRYSEPKIICLIPMTGFLMQLLEFIVEGSNFFC